MGEPTRVKRGVKTAILVDGGFYRKRSDKLFGVTTPEEAAKRLHHYCMALLKDKYEDRQLYRIFYYDCPPSDKVVYHPLTGRSVNLKKSEDYAWMTTFLHALHKYRKVALRLGRMSENGAQYHLKYDTLKKLFRRDITLDDVTVDDFELDFKQKGVDMRVGVDISSLAFKKQVDQIILIAGDSDFVPASKQARREGIDFILDNMESHINDDLFEHIDGIKTAVKRFKEDQSRPAEKAFEKSFRESI